MGFKKIDRTFTFADAILKDSMDKNRCLMRIMDIAKSIDWPSIESVLMGHYQVGTSKEGADAYPPLLLFKCLLLQKWFHPSTIFRTYGVNIDSDPELESTTRYKFNSHLFEPVSKVINKQ